MAVYTDANLSVVPSVAYTATTTDNANTATTTSIVFTGGYPIPANTSVTFYVTAVPTGVVGSNTNSQAITTVLGPSTSMLWTDVNGNGDGTTGTNLPIDSNNYPTGNRVVNNIKFGY